MCNSSEEFHSREQKGEIFYLLFLLIQETNEQINNSDVHCRILFFNDRNLIFDTTFLSI